MHFTKVAASLFALVHTAHMGIARDVEQQPAVACQSDLDSPSLDREWIGGMPFLQWSRLTGDWGTLRTDLEAHGIEIGGSLTMDWSAAWEGG